jgi:hypothetical protein
MAKKRKKQGSGEIKTQISKQDLPSQENQTNASPEDPFNFGGLPKRDLKKNLGCG